MDARWLHSLLLVPILACGPTVGDASGGGDGGDSSEGVGASETGVSACAIVDADLATPPSSSIDGYWVTPDGPGVSIELPNTWVARYAEIGDNLHLSRAQLEVVRDGAVGWDAGLAAVIDAIFDFDDCAAHLGEEGWGATSTTIDDLHVRLYRVAETPEAVVARVTAMSWDGLTPEITVDDDAAPWTTVDVRFENSDAAELAHVEVRVLRFGETTAAVVGLYSDRGDGYRKFIGTAQSSCWDSHGGGCCPMPLD